MATKYKLTPDGEEVSKEEFEKAQEQPPQEPLQDDDEDQLDG